MGAPDFTAETRDDLEMSEAFDAIKGAFETAKENGRRRDRRKRDPESELADFIADGLYDLIEKAKVRIEHYAKIEGERRAAERAEEEAEDARLAEIDRAA